METGAAEAGIVYATDAAVSKKVKVAAEIPEKLTGPIRYPVVLLKHGRRARRPESFYRYLSSPAAAKIFQKYGFTVCPGPRPVGEVLQVTSILSPLECSALRLSFQVTLVAAVVSLPFAVAAGYLLARCRFSASGSSRC